MAKAFTAAFATPITGQADVSDPRQTLADAQVVKVSGGLGRERRKRRKALDVDCRHEVARVGYASVVVVKINDIATERCPIEYAGEEPQHQSEPRALVAADR